MSIVKPERIVFETESDLIDYVGRGMVPTKKNFQKFIIKVHNPDDENIYGPGDITQVSISKNLFLKDCDPETMDRILTRMYQNRVHNRNVMLAVGGIIGGILAVGMIGSGCKHRKEEQEYVEERIVID